MKKLISRRNMLRGAAGACLALPWFGSLAPRPVRAAPLGTPRRFLPIYFPNGASRHWWNGLDASAQGSDWQLSAVLEPLNPLKAKLIHIKNLGNYRGIQEGRNVEPSHARCSASYLTCMNADANEARNGISIDQLLVESSNFGTPLSSLQVGLGTLPGFFDGRPWYYNQAVSWGSSSGAHPTEPLRRVISPKQIFDKLFPLAQPQDPSGEQDPDKTRNAALDRSVLDAVRADSAALKARLSASDALVLDQFESRLRALEIAVGNIDGGISVTPGCQPVTEAPFDVPDSDQELQGEAHENGAVVNGVPYDRNEHANVMNELIVMAFQCDLTRVISYMLDDARSNFRYTHVEPMEFGGTPGDFSFHDGAQHSADTMNNAYASINNWLARKVSELAQALDAIPEGEGTVLDNTVIVFGSGMHSDDHDAAELPITLIGGTGVLRGDQNIVLPEYPGDRQLRDLYFTLMNQFFELGVASFGSDIDGAPNQVLTEILA